MDFPRVPKLPEQGSSLTQVFHVYTSLSLHTTAALVLNKKSVPFSTSTCIPSGEARRHSLQGKKHPVSPIWFCGTILGFQAALKHPKAEVIMLTPWKVISKLVFVSRKLSSHPSSLAGILSLLCTEESLQRYLRARKGVDLCFSYMSMHQNYRKAG